MNIQLSKRQLQDIALILLTSSLMMVGFTVLKETEETIAPKVDSLPQKSQVVLNKYGIATDDYDFEEYSVAKNEYLGDILRHFSFNFGEIALIEQKLNEVFDVNKIKEGHRYSLVRDKKCDDFCRIIYEPDPLQFIVIDFIDSVSVRKKDRAYTSCIETAYGVIENGFRESIISQGLDRSLIDKIEGVFASKIDFYHTRKGDKYKIIYEQIYIDGVPVSVGKILAASYQNKKRIYHSFYYEDIDTKGYYDYNGLSTESTFLKSPVKYSRISSRYNYRRFHPIKKKTIPHLGTDYAAPYGEPIRSVADGIITEVSYNRSNGKYIRIKHEDNFETQYLHMSKYAKNIAPGVLVSKNQTIGYVGKTGLATGSHLCFRFWKDGKQIDHIKMNYGTFGKLKESKLPEYYALRDSYLSYLNMISENIEYAENVIELGQKNTQS